VTTTLALRVDVDTFRGTRDGVPRLLDLLAAHDIRATFFFTMGPDNMGRHLRRLLKPKFLAKMIRSRAASLYGWDVLFAGTFWPGRQIAAALGGVLRATEAAGHELGLHAWDHHRWQVASARMSFEALRGEIARGIGAFCEVVGRPPDCSAAAGWVCDWRVLEAKDELGFRYNSDCRGLTAFVPYAQGRTFAPQVPTTLPTYDEVIGRSGVTPANYNSWLLDQLRPDALNVLTVHAEVEGIQCAPLFDEFLSLCKARNVGIEPLHRVLDGGGPLARDAIVQAPIAGREGNVCWQKSAVAH